MKSKLHIKDLGQLHYFLGIKVQKDDKGIYLSQKKYVLDMLKETRIIIAKSANSPLGIKLQTDEA